VTNKVESHDVFGCIGFDDFTEQQYRPGNGKIESITLESLRERLKKERTRDTDLILKGLKLKIAQMDKLNL